MYFKFFDFSSSLTAHIKMENLMKKLSILLLSIFLVKVQANSEVENEITNTRIFPGTKVSFKAFAFVDFLSNYICTYSICLSYPKCTLQNSFEIFCYQIEALETEVTVATYLYWTTYVCAFQHQFEKVGYKFECFSNMSSF